MSSTIYNFLSFFGLTGKQLIDAADLTALTKFVAGNSTGVTALAGGAQAGAPVLAYGYNEVDTVASTNDSVQMPFAVAGAMCAVNNMSGNTMRIYAQSAGNPANSGTQDQLIARNTVSLTANGTAITIATGLVIAFVCFTTGQWKQVGTP